MEKFFFKKQKFAKKKEEKTRATSVPRVDDASAKERMWTKMKEKSARVRREIERATDVPHLLYFHLKNKLLKRKILLHDPSYTPKEYVQDVFEVVSVKLEEGKNEPTIELQAKDYPLQLPATVDNLMTICVIEDEEKMIYSRLFPAFVEPKQKNKDKDEARPQKGILSTLGKSKLARRAAMTIATTGVLSVSGDLISTLSPKGEKAASAVSKNVSLQQAAEKKQQGEIVTQEEYLAMTEKEPSLTVQEIDSLKKEVGAIALRAQLEDASTIKIMEKEYHALDQEAQKTSTELDSLQKILQKFQEKQKKLTEKFKDVIPPPIVEKEKSESPPNTSAPDTSKGKSSVITLKAAEMLYGMTKVALNSPDFIKQYLFNNAGSMAETALKAIEMLSSLNINQNDLQATIEEFLKRHPDMVDMIDKVPAEFIKQFMQSDEFQKLMNSSQITKLEEAVQGLMEKYQDLIAKQMKTLQEINKQEVEEHVLEKRIGNLVASLDTIRELSKDLSFKDAAKVYSLWADAVGNEYLRLYDRPDKSHPYTMASLLLFQSAGTEWLKQSPIARELEKRVLANDEVKRLELEKYIIKPFIPPEEYYSVESTGHPWFDERYRQNMYIGDYFLDNGTNELIYFPTPDRDNYKRFESLTENFSIKDVEGRKAGVFVSTGMKNFNGMLRWNVPIENLEISTIHRGASGPRKFMEEKKVPQYDEWNHSRYDSNGVLYLRIGDVDREYKQKINFYRSVFGDKISQEVSAIDIPKTITDNSESLALYTRQPFLEARFLDAGLTTWEGGFGELVDTEMKKYGKAVDKRYSKNEVTVFEPKRKSDVYSYHITKAISLEENLFANEPLTEVLYQLWRLPKFKKEYGLEKFAERILSARLTSVQQDYIFEFIQILQREEQKKLREIIEEKNLHIKNSFLFKIAMQDKKIEDIESLASEVETMSAEEKARVKNAARWDKQSTDFYTRNALRTYDAKKHGPDFFDYLERYLMAAHNLAERAKGPLKDY